MEIFIPSYKRSKIFKQLTHKLLKELDKDEFNFNLFLENNEEKDLYLKELGDDAKIYNIIITGTNGIAEKRNFMRNHSANNKYVLYIDDDISRFEKKVDNKTEPVSLKEIIKEGFSICEEKGFCYWGIHTITNGYYMKNEVSTSLKYIQGGFSGEIRGKPQITKSKINHFEDFDATIKYFLRDGGVVRLHNYSLRTKPWRNGGINESLGGLEKRKSTMDDNANYLLKTYGENILKIKNKKWGKEPSLNWRFKTKSVLIAIPSRGRANNILTLNLLQNSKYDIKIIVPEEEVENYGNAVGCPINGIGSTRYWILEKYNKSYDYIVMIDDDITNIIKKVDSKSSESVVIDELIDEMKNTLEERDAFFGGITLCPNLFYAKNRISNNLKYISGALQIYRSSSRETPKNDLKHFEDYDYNIQYFLRDNIVCRWDAIIPITKNYNPIGGICADYGSLKERLIDAEVKAYEIVKKYGDDIVKITYKKGSSRSPACVNLKLNYRFKPL